MWVRVGSEPLTTLFFRRPGPYTSGASGPAAAGASYSYPPPSALAGHVSWALVRSGLASHPGPDGDGFEDIRKILEEACGQGARLIVGLLWRDGSYYLYQNTSVFPHLDAMRRTLSTLSSAELKREGARLIRGMIGQLQKQNPRIVAKRNTPIHISLNRTSKTTRQGLIFTRDEISYPHGTKIISLLYCPNNSVDGIGAVRGPLKLGGDQGVAVLALEKMGEHDVKRILVGVTNEDSKDAGYKAWLAVLTSPALLQRNSIPWSPGRPVQASDPEAARRMAQSLLSGTGIRPTEATVLIVPKGESMVEYLTTGWQTLDPTKGRGRYRRPYLWVPPGTMIYLEGLSAYDAFQLAVNGVGEWTVAGWGSLIMIPLQP